MTNLAALLPGIATCAGVLVAWRSLRSIARARRFDSFTAFWGSWDASRADRDWVRDNLVGPYDQLDDAATLRTRRVINHLHVVALEVENGLISGADVFPLCYVEILRVMYRLKPWIEYQQTLGHERYGLRVLRLASRAEGYHNVDPERRRTRVTMRNVAGTETVIYRAPESAGVLKRASW